MQHQHKPTVDFLKPNIGLLILHIFIKDSLASALCTCRLQTKVKEAVCSYSSRIVAKSENESLDLAIQGSHEENKLVLIKLNH